MVYRVVEISTGRIGPAGPTGPTGPAGAGSSTQRVDPVYIEDYVTGYAAANTAAKAVIRATAGTIITAITAALAANLASRTFILPSGAWNWGTGFMNEGSGLRSNFELIGQHTELYRDLAGAPSGQCIMFMWNYGFAIQTPEALKSDIHVRGVKFSLLNVATSFFSLGWSVECATNCTLDDCEFYCTFAAGAAETRGKARWGCGLFGDALGPTNGGGRNNRITNVRLTNSQIQGCGAGRSCKNILVKNIQVFAANDFAVSVCSIQRVDLGQPAHKMENVTIKDIQCFDVIGSGIVLAGNDGGSPGEGLSEIRNITVENIQGAGSRSTDLDFNYGGSVAFYGGVVTENITLRDIGNKQSGNINGFAFGLNVGGSPDQVDPHAWQGLTISNCQFGVNHDVDPHEAIIVSGPGIDFVTLSEIKCKGPRGITLQNCDYLTVSNVSGDNGTLKVQVDRDLTSAQLSNVNFNRSTGFLPAIWFTTLSTNKNVASAQLSNCYMNSQVEGLRVDLEGGSMGMQIVNCNNAGAAINAETIVGLKRSWNNINIPNVPQFVGPQGPPGNDGLDGADGNPGPAGATGAPGPTGPQGPPGLDGNDGEPGPPGLPGATGLTGFSGSTGPQGPTGPMGPMGPPGNDGIDGSDGLDGPSGTSGSPGAMGPQGIPGPQGPPGNDGLDGADGQDGPMGPAGAGLPGATGATGPAGSNGLPGPPGNDGIDGIDGLDGPVGMPGAAGSPGTTGATGATGPQGPPGNDGEPGQDGADGIPGVAGPVGPTGPVGDTGPAGVSFPGPPGNDGQDCNTETIIILQPVSSGVVGGSVNMTDTSVTLSYSGLKSDTAVVADALITPASKIMLFWGQTLETDDNTPDMSDLTFSATAGSGAMTVRLSTTDLTDRLGGVYKLRYMSV